MNIGILLPGFSGSDDDWAIPVQSELMIALTAMGHAVRVIALRYPHRHDRYRAFGADVVSLGYGQARGMRRFALWRAALGALRRLHGETPFDVLHAMWADETGMIAAWAGRRLGVPSAVSVLGGEFARHDDIAYGGQRTPFGRWITRGALRADRVIVPSDGMRRLIADAGFAVEDGRFRKVVLGVNTLRFTPPPAKPDPRRLIHVASLVPVKDQTTLLRAVALLPDVTLDIVGQGSEEGRLKALTGALGIADRVVFHGAAAYPDLPAFYRRAGLFILTSRHEANNMAALEAAACGLPSVSTAVGMLPEHADFAECVPVGDATGLAAAVRRLINDPSRYDAMQRAALERARDTFTIEATAAHSLGVYDELRRG
ncbi:MAG: glycosyltransferase family 4 protein [Anaerolineae bacterium]|nr:glycosyltransferase family 4 protein [Anaerolineae bacterium]